jgi:hypothetical protein
MEAPTQESKQVLRGFRDGVVDLIVALARVLFFWIPGDDLVKGRALMTFHPLLLLFTTLAFFTLPPRSGGRILILMLALGTVASQWLLGGCVITRAEQRLTGNKETIADPFLKLARIRVDRDTRLASTLGVGTTTAVILSWACLCDAIRMGM